MTGEAPGEDEGVARLLKAAEVASLMREVAQVVKRPDIGKLLAAVGLADPLAKNDSVPKRKRITAALIATDHREPDRGWIDRLLAAVDEYDRIHYVQRVERVAEHIVELDKIRQVAPTVPGWSDDGRDVSAHVALTYWGGNGRLARRAIVLVREGNRETQIELDIDGTAAAIAGLTRAQRQLEDSKRYLENRRPEKRQPGR